mmetsp:Transcript_26435/g.39090  ORF Transcript_26435/g.39090 Transcript_26435/m.39090 type:complete len:440 (+) Transcript_26435:31-1350(+)
MNLAFRVSLLLHRMRCGDKDVFFVDDIQIEKDSSKGRYNTICWLIAFISLAGSVAAAKFFFPEVFKFGNDILHTFGSSCEISLCNDLSVVSLHKNGDAHPCKDYCIKKVAWEFSSGDLPSTNQAYGSFNDHGVCATRHDLRMNEERSLIPKRFAEGGNEIPDYISILNRMQNKNLIMVGGSVMKQIFEVLPSVLEDSSIQIVTDAFAYISPTKHQRVKKCDTDFKKESQSCVYQDDRREACTCTTVTQMHSVDSGTSIHFVWAYGIEFLSLNETITFGKSFNVARESLYTELSNSADMIILNFGIIAHETKHQETQYKDYLSFINRWSDVRNVAFLLSLPQHFHTESASGVGYLDEKRALGGGCVNKRVARHWTDELARETLKGKVDLIDVYPLMSDRGNLHSIKNGNCAEWCLAFELFYPFWDATAVLVEDSDGIKDV